MTIEILNTQTQTFEGQPHSRYVEIIITSGPTSYQWSVGGLPLTGDLQTILEANEAELFTAASVVGKPVDLYDVVPKRVLKAFALVVMDEINILRQNPTGVLPVRTANQIETAIKNKLKTMG